MNPKLITLIAALGLSVGVVPFASAAASGYYSFNGTVYTQNFNSLPDTLTTETNGKNATDITGLTGWQVVNGGSASSTISWRGQNSGAGTGAGYYALGSASEYALGGLSNGSTNMPAFGITLLNTSGSQINDLTVSFDVEQWRVGNTNSANVLAFEYKLSGTYASIAGTTADTSFLSPGASANVSSFVSSSSASALNGNLDANNASVTLSLTSLGWNAGSYLVLRWEIRSGSLDSLGIDNVSIGSIPEPSTYAALFGLVSLLGATVCRRSRRS